MLKNAAVVASLILMLKARSSFLLQSLPDFAVRKSFSPDMLHKEKNGMSHHRSPASSFRDPTGKLSPRISGTKIQMITTDGHFVSNNILDIPPPPLFVSSNGEAQSPPHLQHLTRLSNEDTPRKSWVYLFNSTTSARLCSFGETGSSAPTTTTTCFRQ